MSEPSLFKVCVSQGSSPEELRAKFNATRDNRYFGRMEFAVSDTFTVYLHHGSTHLDLMEDQGLRENDVMFLGNLEAMAESTPPCIRLVVRFKGHEKIPADLKLPEDDEGRGNAIMALIEEVDREICRFLFPLWEGPGPLLDSDCKVIPEPYY